MKKIGVAILGGTGYGARELLRLLSQHPHVEIVEVVSSSAAGKAISDLHPSLLNIYSMNFSSELTIEKFQKYERVFIFTALPHGASIAAISQLLSQELTSKLSIVDLSGDLRIKNAETHARHYPETDLAPELRKEFCYGLTELYRKEVTKARHISNPGCYPTACSLAIAPIVKKLKISGSVIFNAASGTSGAGRQASEATHHPARNANYSAYKVLAHRHEPEIAQALGDTDQTQLSTMFIPHLLPVSRGILATVALTLSSSIAEGELFKLYEDFYKDCPFIRLRKDSPDLAQVVGSNFCDIGIKVRGQQVVAIAAIDNLVKGMAGQAIQNMNLMLGLPETTGLSSAGLGLV